jgi:hypothetical protein
MTRAVRTQVLAILVSVAAHAAVALSLWFLSCSAWRIASDALPIDTGGDLTIMLVRDRVGPSPPAGDEEQHVNAEDFPVRIGEANTASGQEIPTPVLVRVPHENLKSGLAAGAAGRGIPGTQGGVLAVPHDARTVVYVVDRSLSMGLNGALARARREVVASLRALPPDASFQIVLYNRQAELLRVDRRRGFLWADAATIVAVGAELERIAALGNTDHFRALKTALALQADVLFLVTDADDLTDPQVRELTRLNDRRTIIHALELNRRSADTDSPLHRLALASGGTHRRVSPSD